MSNGSYNSNGGAADAGDMQRMMQQSLTQGITAMGNHDYSKGEDSTTLFGISMDAGVAKAFNMVYTAFGHKISDYLSPRVYNSVIKFGPSVKKITGVPLEGIALNRTAAATALAVNLGVFLGPGVSELYHKVMSQHDAREAMRRQLAPILDDMYGSHTMGTLNRVQPEADGKTPGNSVIVAARRRMNKENSTVNMGIVWATLGKNLLNVWGQATNFKALTSGLTLNQVEEQRYQDLFDKHRHDVEAEFKTKGTIYKDKKVEDTAINRVVQERVRKERSSDTMLGMAGGGAMLSQFADAMAKSSKNRLQHSRQPYSALEMITSLQEQVQNNPGGVKRFALPGRKGGELSLEQYVAEILKLHMREMSDFDPRYTELRDALKNDIDAIGKAIAEPIASGDLNPLLLVRLVGEGQIIKNRGRGLASIDEVNAQIERFAQKSHSFMVGDVKEYLTSRTFTLDHVKDALKHLEGEERLDFAATLPDPVLHAAGMSDAEQKLVQEHRAQSAHDVFLMHEVMGVAATPDAELQEAGLGSTQIKRLHKDAELIREGGEQAIRKLKSGPTNADGVEHILNDFVTPKIAGDKEYLGTVVAAGRDALEHPRHHAAANDHDGETRGHADKFKPKTHPEHANNNHGHAANDDSDYGDEMSHAERLAASRGHRAGHSKAFD